MKNIGDTFTDKNGKFCITLASEGASCNGCMYNGRNTVGDCIDPDTDKTICWNSETSTYVIFKER